MLIPKQLISLLNSGRCVAVIGSGPSCEVGYPSWHKLAELALEYAKTEKAPLEANLFSRLMKANDYPKMFKYLEASLSRPKLVTFIQSQLSPVHSDGKTCAMLAKWPFRFYMTTNWDSSLHAQLSRIGYHFTEINNSRSEITQLTDDTTKQIVKLHGMLSDSGSLVLTEDDYQTFKVADERLYFRETLKSLFRTLPVVVIGHSMTDPDLQTILEAAKTIAPSQRPIYMIVAEPHKEEVDTFHARYNIHLIGFKRDPSYSNFQKLLRLIDRFVVPRTGSVVRVVDPPPQQEIEVATSLLVFNSLSKSLDNPHLLDRLVHPQILQQLKRSNAPLHKEQVRALLMPEALRLLPTILDRLEVGFARLANENSISGNDTDGWQLTSSGEAIVSSASATQRFEDDQVYGTLKSQLKSAGVIDSDCDKAAQALKVAILSVFRKRGIATASLVFRGQEFEPVDMAELFEAITTSVEWAESFELREAYIDFALRLFSHPSLEERRYLARVSQGLFAVHVFGVDPVSVDARTQVFKSVTWFLDSNVLIHLLATGSAHHEMASSICDKCNTLGIKLFASHGVVEEAMNCLGWASKMCSSLKANEEMSFILQVYNEDGYRPNPFIDGYVAMHQKEGLVRFAEYQNKLLQLYSSHEIVLQLRGKGIAVVGLEQLTSDNQRRKSFNDFKNLSLIERERRGTSRGGEFQANVEAEVLCLILAERDKQNDNEQKLEKAYFVSSSRLLDHLFGNEHGTLTWLPDPFFRHLSLIAPSAHDPDSLIEAIGSELAELGVTLVDEEAYRQYFSPLISSSRMSFEKEQNAFVEAIKEETTASRDELQREFDATPDTDKPLFVSQMQWRLTEKETAKLHRELDQTMKERNELTDKLKITEVEWERRQKETIRHLENRIRNLSDPTRRKKLERKSKNKRKKGRKRK
jgi:hypothetical protein